MPCISWRSDVATTTQTNPKQDHVTFRISVERLTRILIWTVLALAVTNLIAQILRWKGKAADISRFFDGNQKVNIPTGYKVFMLVASALTVLAIARAAQNANDPWAGRWYFLAAVVGLLAFDETVYLHQSLSDFLDKHFQSESLPHFKWVIVYLPASRRRAAQRSSTNARFVRAFARSLPSPPAWASARARKRYGMA